MTEISIAPSGFRQLSNGGLNNIVFILNQNTSTHNMLHFTTAISITTWFILLQYPPQHSSLYCKIHHNLVHFTAISQHASCYYNTNHNMLHFTATGFILLQYQPQHASFYWNMLHFTGDWVEEQPTCVKLSNYIKTKKVKLEAQF